MAKERVVLEIIEGGKGGPPKGPPPAPPDDGTGASAIHGSHIQLQEKLLERLGADWKFAGGHWFGWDGKRWHKDEKKVTWRSAINVCRNEGALVEDGKLARQIMSRPSVYAALDLASADTQVACAMSEFDPDPWLLNTPDGVVNLKTGQLEPHNRDYLMTKLAAAGPLTASDSDEISGHGGCPDFLAYLDSATGKDDALKHYLQRLAGYCLTGSIEEHCIIFFHGPGGTGKTLFLLIIQDLLGDYAINAPMNAFTFTMGERHPTEMARMVGARVVTASEVDEGVRWDEGKLKAISGGDKITAHFMRQDDFTFEPQFKLLLAGNHRPRMRSADDAMRRRMQVVPFRHKPKNVDKQLREKLRLELPGILRWAIQGELERRRLGRAEPAALGAGRHG
jgi:putative DNA primase/helicase